MKSLHVIAGPGVGQVVAGLEVLQAAYDVHVTRASEVNDLPTGVEGHLLLTTSVPARVLAAVTAWPAGHVQGLILLADSAESEGLSAHLQSLAVWGLPTLVIAPAEGVFRETGQRLCAGVPDAVFVVTEGDAAEPDATTVQWMASFLSIVDGLRAEVVR